MEPTRYLFSDVDAVIATFHVLDGINTYFFNFRLPLLIVLRALAHLIICLVLLTTF